MATPLSSHLQSSASSESTSRRPRQSTRLKILIARHLDKPKVVVHVNPATRKASGPQKEKFCSYLGMVAQDKINILYPNWKVVLEALKNLNDIVICPLNISVLVIGCI